MPRPLPTIASAFVFLCPIFAVSPMVAQSAVAGASDAALPRLTIGLRARLWAQSTAAPMAWLAPGLDAGFSMAHPLRHQPAAWSVGAGGFAHLYAGYLARQSAATAAQSVVAALLREDTRYQPSTERNPLRRAAHAASFALLDRRVSGRRMVAVSSLAGALTAAALANTWVAPQFQNSAHLTQRTLTSLAALAGATIAAEFHPDAEHLARRIPGWLRLHRHRRSTATPRDASFAGRPS